VQVLPVGFNNVNASSIKIYPNPSENYIQIKGIKKPSILRIYNLQGSLVQEFNNVSNDSKIIHHLNSGYYILKVIEGNDTLVDRLIVK
jgi:hypothetical protein